VLSKTNKQKLHYNYYNKHILWQKHNFFAKPSCTEIQTETVRTCC